MDEFTLEEFRSDLEHLDFMDECRKLVENIAWALATHTAVLTTTKKLWDDIDVYGDEPVFTSLLMDMLERETK